MSSSVQCIESVGSPFFPATRGGAAARAQMGLSRAAPQNLVGRAALAALGALKGGCAELSIGLCSRGTAIGGGERPRVAQRGSGRAGGPRRAFPSSVILWFLLAELLSCWHRVKELNLWP